jgi:hypothetical protein
MKDEWISFLKDILEEIKRLDGCGCDSPLFRGHNNSTWKLIPSLYRTSGENYIDWHDEETIHGEFTFNSGPIFNRKLGPWEILFEMRHAGIPTRLLDWTENFGSALFFALNNVNWDENWKSEHPITPCIWILDPLQLNLLSYNNSTVQFVNELGFEYHDLIKGKENDEINKIKGPIAIMNPQMQQRSFAQKSVFTLHMGS